jgi:hypothetical protein
LAKSPLDRMARGMAREEAIMRAKQEGHSFGDIGAALGISRKPYTRPCVPEEASGDVFN